MPIAEINAIRDKFIEALSPVRIYLFGPFADGTNTEDSDFDFYIVVKDNTENLAAHVFRHVRLHFGA